MNQEPRIFETSNADLATFLLKEDIQLLEIVRSNTNQNIVIIRFIDAKRNCLDLERVYLNSEFKKFRDLNKYLLGKIHETLRK